MTKITILGLGAMGSRIAQSLLQANYEVTVYNRTADRAKPLIEQGAICAHTPKAAAESANIIISMVTDDTASQSIWLNPDTGALLGLDQGKTVITSSTLTVHWTQKLAAAVQQQGAAFLDAPVVGSRPQADAGKLIYLVGGKAKTLDQVRPILQKVGAAMHHVGGTGQGMAMKLAVNALFGIQVAALAELLSLLDRYGISNANAMACLGNIPVISPAAKGAGGLMVAQNHAPLFPIDLVTKDFRYVVETAQAADVSAPVTTAIQSLYQEAIDQGYGQDNITGVTQLFQ